MCVRAFDIKINDSESRNNATIVDGAIVLRFFMGNAGGLGYI